MTVFWRGGRVAILRHYEGLYELVCGEDSIMTGSFEVIANYVWAEFPPW